MTIEAIIIDFDLKTVGTLTVTDDSVQFEYNGEDESLRSFLNELERTDLIGEELRQDQHPTQYFYLRALNRICDYDSIWSVEAGDDVPDTF